MNTEYKALAADGKTAHGLSPVLAILDEIGQVQGPQSAFVDAITTSQGAHAAPLLIAISTQAASDADLFSVWLDDADRSNDPRIVSRKYSAPEGCALDDESAWSAANPALDVFRSLADLREQAKQAARMPSMENTFRNLILNQRVSVSSPFVSPGVWKACGSEPGEFDGPVFGGLDLSARTDLTAFVLYDHHGNDRAARDRAPYDVWHRQGFLRTTPGATVDYAHVVAEIVDIVADVDLHAVAFDRWRIDVFKKEMERLGVELPLTPWGQGFKDMSPALDSLEAELLNGRIAHAMHPVLTMCAANAVVTKDPAGSRKLDKGKATGRIDGLQALAMAVGVAGIAPAPLTAPDTLFAMI